MNKHDLSTLQQVKPFIVGIAAFVIYLRRNAVGSQSLFSPDDAFKVAEQFYDKTETMLRQS